MGREQIELVGKLPFKIHYWQTDCAKEMLGESIFIRFKKYIVGAK